jgi:hypothetical protein
MFNQEQSQEIINRRHKIVCDYCAKMGWEANPEKLTIEQIMEIRSKKEWKEVPQLVIEGKTPTKHSNCIIPNVKNPRQLLGIDVVAD